jgi:hypothetical protein
VTTHVVSTAIIVERQEDDHAYQVQRPVHFVSEVLSESKARYQPVQKLLYAVLITSRKLLEESPSGQSNSVPSPSTSSHAQPSSRRH